MPYYVYVLKNPAGRFYVGQSADVEQRLENHNDVTVFQRNYTRKNGPWQVIWTEAHSTRSSAVQRERSIKRMKSAKWIRDNLLKEGQSAVNPG